MNPIKLKYANPEQFIADIDGICRNQLHVFRGESFIYEHVSSSIYRKYARHFLRDDKLLPLDVEKEIVERARKVLYSESTPIPEILTDIRHFGGDTTLIDFTRSLPVALFFGCNGRFDADGRIIAVPAKRIPQKFSLKHYEARFEAEEEEKEKISEKDRMEYSEAEKKMSFLNPSRTFSSRARTEFQSSIFIHAPKGYLDEAESGYVSIILPKKSETRMPAIP